LAEEKIKIAVCPGAGCGGCDVSLVNLHEKLLELSELVDIVYWPTAIDQKMEDLEKIEHIDIVIFEGSIRTKAHEELLKMARKKAKILVAYGACACFGGIYALGNLFFRKELLEMGYLLTPSTENEQKKFPGELVKIDNIIIKIPELIDWNMPLDKLVSVDVYAPGCPPRDKVLEKLVEVIKDYIENGLVPERGVVLADIKTICDECPREKPDKIVIRRFRRIHEGPVDPEKCFLAQGIICLGPVTRSGCGLPCIKANMPCRGCMGPAPAVKDPGAKFITSLASLIEVDRERSLSDEELVKRVQEIPDPVGYFYRFTLGRGIIDKTQREEGEG